MASQSSHANPGPDPVSAADRLLFELDRDGIVYSDRSGKILAVNPAFTVITGIAPEEVVGRSVLGLTKEFISLRDLPRILAYVGRFLRGETVPDWELNFKNKRLSIESPPRHGSGDLLITFIRDITEEHRHQDTLKTVSQDLAWLNQCSRKLIAMTSVQDLHRFISDEIFGHFQPVMVGTSDIDEGQSVFTTRSFRAVESLASRAMEILGGNPVGQTYRLDNAAIREELFQAKMQEVEGGLTKITFGRIPRPLALMIERLIGMDRFLGQAFLVDGRILGTVALAFRKADEPNIQILEAFLDLCGQALQRCLAEERLRLSESRLQAVAEATTDSIYTLNPEPDGRVKLTFETQSLSGYSLEEIAAPEQWARVFFPEDLPGVKDQLERVLRDGVPGEFTSRLRTREGGFRWVRFFFRPRFAVAGKKVESIVAAAKDITREREIEAENRRLEEQVQQVRKLESLGMLAGGIAHDFNNLFMGLFGFLEVALHRAAKEIRIAEPLEKAMRVIDKAKALTGRLITLSKGGAPIRTPVRLEPLLRTRAEADLAGTDVAVRWDLAPGLPLLSADEGQVGQAFGHILENARLAMEDRGTLTITALPFMSEGLEPVGLAPGPYVRVTFTDSGPGIPAEDLPKIFDPFFTTRPSRTGLGLTLVYSILARHGGLVTIDSPEQSGARVKVYLPAAGGPA